MKGRCGSPNGIRIHTLHARPPLPSPGDFPLTGTSLCRNLAYVCKEGGSCTVDVSRRNQCQACRFRKCLEVNMKKDGKCKSRGGSNTRNFFFLRPILHVHTRALLF